MRRSIRLLALGDYSRYQYHPFSEVSAVLKEGLADTVQTIHCTEERDELLPASLTAYDAILSYADSWQGRLTDEQMKGLLWFVASGGGFVAVHCGISPENPEHQSLIGARFTGHPPKQDLSIIVADRRHPITAGLENFHVEDELYQFEWLAGPPRAVLLQALFGGKACPVAWTRPHGTGRVVYLALGHSAEVFKIDPVMKFIVRSVLWSVKLI